MSSVSVGQTLSAVTTAGGLYPQLDQAIIQLTMPFAYARNFCVLRSLQGQAGNTYTFARQTGSRTIGLSEIAPGAFIPMDSTPYGYSAVQVYKIAEGFVVTRELVEDTYLPVIQDHMVRFGVRAAYKLDKDIWTTIINGAGTSTAATGNSLGATGTLFSAYRSGAIGQQDIVQRITDITKINYLPDYVGLNPIQEQDVFMLPMFSQAWQYGSPVVREGVQLGAGTPNSPVYNTTPIISNAVPAGTAVVLASAMSKNVLGQYAPGIFLVEKRPLMTDQEKLPARDAQAVYFTARYAPSVQVGGVISLITGLATS